MNYYIGIDLGTSSLKGLLTDHEGRILKSASRDYPVEYPSDGWTQQDPAHWERAMNEVLSSLADGIREEVRGISFGGQMHGLVVLDKDGRPIRPCILWNDGRSSSQTAYLNEVIGREELSRLTGNIAFAGFTAPKILWLRENEPENFSRIASIMLPKDYLVYLLTGKLSCDYSDASGTLLLDVENRRWSSEMCGICSVKEEWLPPLHESFEVVGKALERYGLPNALVIAGAGDNAAAAVGTGTVENGSCNISLGTSGTVFISSDSFSVDANNSLHSFCHADGRWHLMGCILSAASCRRWWLEDILSGFDYDLDEEEVLGCDTGDTIFLPYLTGERSPHNDVDIRGAFINLGATTTRAQMSRAVMEGVAFALRDCMEIAKLSNDRIIETTLCGGGAKSKAWRQILSDVLDTPIDIPETEQGPSYGAAILAMVGCGEYPSVDAACEKLIRTRERICPDREAVKRYEKKYRVFRKLYPLLKSLRE